MTPETVFVAKGCTYTIDACEIPFPPLHPPCLPTIAELPAPPPPLAINKLPK